MTKNDVNINKIIREPWRLPDKMFDVEWTKSTLFLLPMIDITLNKEKWILDHFENCFLKDLGRDNDITRPLFLLCSTKEYNLSTFKKCESFFRRNKYFIDEYDVGVIDNKFYIMYVFQIPEIYNDDYYHFKRSRYSSLSENLKKAYSQTIINKDKVFIKNIAYHAANVTDELKQIVMKEFDVTEDVINDMDGIWDFTNPEREYYRYYKRKINE